MEGLGKPSEWRKKAPGGAAEKPPAVDCGPYQLDLCGINTHICDKVLQMVADLWEEIPGRGGLRTKGRRWWVPGEGGPRGFIQHKFICSGPGASQQRSPEKHPPAHPCIPHPVTSGGLTLTLWDDTCWSATGCSHPVSETPAQTLTPPTGFFTAGVMILFSTGSISSPVTDS